MKENKNSVEFVVLACFIRTIKSDGKYMLFRKGVNNTGIMKALIKEKNNFSDNPFRNVSDLDGIIKTLKNITENMVKRGINNFDKYEHVTITINHLLHFFLEPYGLSMDKLCSLGEEIYNISCNKLFGDAIEELEKSKEEETESLPFGADMKARLFNEYVNEINNGTINSRVTFEDYIKSKFNKLKDLSKSNKTAQFGQVLGMVPNDKEDFLQYSNFSRPSWLDELI